MKPKKAVEPRGVRNALRRTLLARSRPHVHTPPAFDAYTWNTQ